MDIELAQNGRAAMDFLIALKGGGSKLEAEVAADLAATGLTADTLAEDLDERLDQVEAAMAGSDAFRLRNLISDWSSHHHGRIATAAFDEIRGTIVDDLDRLTDGRTSIETNEGFEYPDYLEDVHIHRTTGGWEGHPYMGIVHAELVHKRYTASFFGSNILDQRRAVLDDLPRKDFADILELGASSGYHTLALADAFPRARITGIDVSRRMLEQAARAANERQLAWRLIVGRAEDTGLPDASFDLVSSFILLHELPADVIRAMIAESYRVLRPGGLMLITDVPPYSAQDRLTVWKYDRLAKFTGEPYWRESGLLDLQAPMEAVGFEYLRGSKLSPKANYWVTIARKPG